MFRKSAVLGLLMSLLAGCAVPTQHQETFAPLPFDESEYAALPKSGTGVVRGQVFARTVGGDVKKGAGQKVLLIPITRYREQWYKEVFLAHKLPAPPQDPRYVTFNKTKTTDGEGRFEFADVPPGRYFVVSTVQWEAISDNRYMRQAGLTETQGGEVLRRIEVRNGAVAEAILNYN